MQRRTFFKAFAAVAGYLGTHNLVQASVAPSVMQDPFEVLPISAGAPAAQPEDTYTEGPYIISLTGLRFIVPSYYMALRYESELTVHMASGVVLKNKVAKTDGGRFIEIGEDLEIPILDYLTDTAAMWPELDPYDDLNDALTGRARKALVWAPRVRSALHAGGDRAAQIRAFHTASIGKSTYYSDWPV